MFGGKRVMTKSVIVLSLAMYSVALAAIVILTRATTRRLMDVLD